MDEAFLKLMGFHKEVLVGFAVSVGIGFLIGLERQFTKEVKEKDEQFAGVRTFTMISIFGFLSAFLAAQFGTWLFGVAFACHFALVITSYLRISHEPGNRGGTSEIAMILTFLLGGIVFLKYILFALIITVVQLLLLAYKPHLHGFIKKMTREELMAIVLFVVMSALVLPFLPDTKFGPYDLWNLKEIWKMVILVSGISLVGYMISKIMGNKGTLIAGIVGGLVSSTSVTLAFSRRSKEAAAGTAFYFAIGIIAACTIMFPRILFEVYVVNRRMALELWIPIVLITVAGLAASFFIYKRRSGQPGKEELPLKNPLNFGIAIKFALLYAGIQWLVKFCQEEFGDRGTYAAGAISGITDVDAITLSMAKMGGTGDSVVAINTILLAAFSNTLVKFIIVLSIGNTELRKTAVIGFGAMFLAGLAYFLFSLFN